MQNFKIIGLKIENGCNPKIHKVLKPGMVYNFYSNITINDESDEIIEENLTCEKLFNQDNVNVNITAIAGKNGSGKSTLIDVFFMIINNFSMGNIDFEEKLSPIKGLKASLYFKLEDYYKVSINETKSYVYRYKKNKISQKPELDFKFKNFFYTVAINYSQYALNSTDLGEWLNNLFHKNDGYQIPIVINPMRTKGNFDINSENELVNSRLITNLVRPIINKNIDFRKISDNLIANRLKLSANNRNILQRILYVKKSIRSKGNSTSELYTEIKSMDLQVDRMFILNRLSEFYDFKYSEINTFSYDEVIDPLYKNCLDYLIYKLVNIAVTYPTYFEYFDKENDSFVEGKFDSYLKELLFNDKSHIGFKIKQTLNFLKYQHYSLSTKVLTFDSITKKINDLIEDDKNNLNEENRIELLPPPIFKTEIILHPIKDNKKEPISFSTLSSGEKQLIYSVNSILYHLVNLDSVSKGIKYENILLILDEIELYFHPDFQRKYINHIIESISTINFKNIKNINLCFITHSPFILSDIPNSNILFLEIDPEKSKYSTSVKVIDKTFSANIHDLLSQSFFLRNGFMGEFATEKIKDIIDDINKIKSGDKIFDDEKFKEERLLEIKQIIDIVGEPILRQKLSEIYNEIDIETNEDKIKRLELELENAKQLRDSK